MHIYVKSSDKSLRWYISEPFTILLIKNSFHCLCKIKHKIVSCDMHTSTKFTEKNRKKNLSDPILVSIKPFFFWMENKTQKWKPVKMSIYLFFYYRQTLFNIFIMLYFAINVDHAGEKEKKIIRKCHFHCCWWFLYVREKEKSWVNSSITSKFP